MSSLQTRRNDVPRRLVRFTARIESTRGQAVCVIVDRSRRGAKIAINPELELLKRFCLEIQPGFYVQARVAWRNGAYAGLRLEKIKFNRSATSAQASVVSGAAPHRRKARSTRRTSMGQPPIQITPPK